MVEGRIRVGAGAIAADVERAARGAGFTLPPLPSSAPWATLGGMIANNAAGARSFGYGAMSAWVTALEGFRADGSFVRLEQDAPTHPNAPGTAPLPPGPVPVGPSFDDAALLLARWPEVRKNSSGYALDRFFAQKTHNPFPLMVGAEGTLLVLTAAELRLSPAAPVRGVHLLPVQSAAELGALAQQAPETGAVSCEFLGRRLLQVLAAVGDPIFMEGVLPAHGVALMLLEFEGQDPAHVEAGLARARSLGTQFSGGGFGTLDPEVGARLWGLRHRASPLIAEAAGEHLVSTQFIEDSVVPLPALGHYIEGVEAILADEETDAVIFGHAGDGNVHVNPLLDLRHPHAHARVRRILSRTVDLVSDLGGTLAGEHGDGRLRTPFAERIWGARRLAAFAQIKAHWDPEGRLNPGVKVPLFGQDPLEGFSPSHRRWPPSKSEGA